MAGAVPQLLLQFDESLPLVLVQPRFQHPAQFLVGGARLGPVEVLLSRVGHPRLAGGVTGERGQPALVARDQGLAMRVESQPAPEPPRGLAEHRRQRQVERQLRPSGRGELPGDEGAQALPGQRAVALLQPAQVDRGVLDGRVDLDRGDRDGLEVGEPAEGRSGHRAERVVRETDRAARDRIGTAELCVYEGQHDDRDRADTPGQERRGPRGLGRVEGATRHGSSQDNQT